MRKRIAVVTSFGAHGELGLSLRFLRLKEEGVGRRGEVVMVSDEGEGRLDLAVKLDVVFEGSRPSVPFPTFLLPSLRALMS